MAMKSSALSAIKKKLLLPVLLSACAVNFYFLAVRVKPSVELMRRNWLLSNPQRRYSVIGPLYEKIFSAEAQIPKRDGIRLVSTSPAWYLAYYLYPRLLRLGSTTISKDEILRVQSEHPNDWLLIYGEINNRTVWDVLPPRRSS